MKDDTSHLLCECNSPNCAKIIAIPRGECAKIAAWNYFIVSTECAFGYQPWGVLVEEKEGYYVVKEKII